MAAAAANSRDKALDVALANIDKQFGKGSVMRLGDDVKVAINLETVKKSDKPAAKGK